MNPITLSNKQRLIQNNVLTSTEMKNIMDKVNGKPIEEEEASTETETTENPQK